MLNRFNAAGRKTWSLRGQIILLGGLAFGTVAGAVVLGVQTLNQTEAARVGDAHVCAMVTGVVPHVGGPILPPGCPTVLIGSMPAAQRS